MPGIRGGLSTSQTEQDMSCVLRTEQSRLDDMVYRTQPFTENTSSKLFQGVHFHSHSVSYVWQQTLAQCSACEKKINTRRSLSIQHSYCSLFARVLRRPTFWLWWLTFQHNRSTISVVIFTITRNTRYPIWMTSNIINSLKDQVDQRYYPWDWSDL